MHTPLNHSKYNRLISIICVFALTLFLTACGNQETPKPSKTVNLISLFEVARKTTETGRIDILSPQRYYALPEGWSFRNPNTRSGLLVVAAVAKESVFRYKVVRRAHRWLSFKVGLAGRLGNLDKQHVEIWITNPERKLAAFDVSGDGFVEKLISIPDSVQESGDNELLFRFSEFAQNPNYLKSAENYAANPFPGVACYFGDIEIHLGNRQRPFKQRIRHPDYIFNINEQKDKLTQLPNSEFSFAFEIKPETILVLSGSAKSDRETPHTVEILASVRTDDEPEWICVWQKDVDLGGNKRPERIAAKIPMERWVGNPAEIRISVLDSAPVPRASIVWNQLQLELGRAETPEEAKDSRAKIDLRDQIKNVVIIVLDAARADHFGCYGNEAGMTPSVDTFAEDSIVFMNAATPAPYTLATTWNLFTGQHYTSTKMHGATDKDSVLPEKTLLTILRQNGYSTVGASGNAYLKHEWPLFKNFDHFYFIRSPENMGALNSEMDIAKVEEGIRIAAGLDNPFFMYIHYLPPHWPYYPPEPFNSHFINNDQNIVLRERKWLMLGSLIRGDKPEDIPDLVHLKKRYMNNMIYADYLAAETLRLLKKYDLFENSMIVVMADHGEALGDHWFLEHGDTVYEELIKVPLIVRIPGAEPRTILQQVGTMDIFPTLIETLNLETGDFSCMGRSIAPLLAGQELESGSYYYSRAASTKLIFAMRGERYKYIFNQYIDALYDLQNDPGEKTNIAEQFPVLTSMLRQQGLMITCLVRRSTTGIVEETELTEEEERELRNLGYLH